MRQPTQDTRRACFPLSLSFSAQQRRRCMLYEHAKTRHVATASGGIRARHPPGTKWATPPAQSANIIRSIKEKKGRTIGNHSPLRVGSWQKIISFICPLTDGRALGSTLAAPAAPTHARRRPPSHFSLSLPHLIFLPPGFFFHPSKQISVVHTIGAGHDPRFAQLVR